MQDKNFKNSTIGDKECGILILHFNGQNGGAPNSPIILSDPKKCSLFFEHLFQPLKLRCFQSVCCRRSLNLSLLVKISSELSKGKNTTAHKSTFFASDFF